MTRADIKEVFRKNIAGWLFNLPLFVGLLVFTVIPVISSLVYSFFDYDVVFKMDFIGFDNYVRIFTDDSEVGKSALNTIIYTVVSVPMSLVLSYLLAVLVNKSLKGISIFRVIFYLPCMIPAVVSGMIWKDVLDPTLGIFNQLLGKIGIGPIGFLKDPKTAMASIFLMNCWTIGGGMILWLAAFKNIPSTLYEAANIDGAGRLTKLFRITIPLSTSMIFFNIVTMLIGTLQYNGTLTFADRYGRGPEDSVFMYGVKLYHEAFRRTEVGYASALAWVLLVVIAACTFVLFKTNKWVYYGEEG